MTHWNIAEQCDFTLDFIGQRMLASAYQNIRLDSHSLQFLDACLCRLGLHFFGSLQIRDQGNMDQNRIVMSDIMLELTDGFQERLALDISDRSADLNDRDSFF